MSVLPFYLQLTRLQRILQQICVLTLIHPLAIGHLLLIFIIAYHFLAVVTDCIWNRLGAIERGSMIPDHLGWPAVVGSSVYPGAQAIVGGDYHAWLVRPQGHPA